MFRANLGGTLGYAGHLLSPTVSEASREGRPTISDPFKVAPTKAPPPEMVDHTVVLFQPFAHLSMVLDVQGCPTSFMPREIASSTLWL
jgi:hypothetical protein